MITARKRIPIRKRFLKTVLLPAIISILAVSVTGFLCIRWIRSATEKTLTEQLEINLRNNISQNVRTVDSKLSHYERYIEFMKDYIENMYGDRKRMISRGRMFYAPADTKDYAMTRIFASEDLTEDDLHDDLLFFSNLRNIWDPIARENEDMVSTIYLGTKDGLLASYDRYSYLSVPPPGRETVYNYYVSEWYRRGMKEDGTFYTGVYMDSQGRGLTVTVASGFKDDSGEPAGVVCMDFDLSSIYESMFATGLDDGTKVFVMDHKGTIISPDADIVDKQEHTGLSLDELDELMDDEDGILELKDSVYICIPMERMGWTMFACTPKTAIQKSIHDADNSIRDAFLAFVAVVILILGVSVIIVNKSVRSITYPLELLGKDIKKISDGELEHRAVVYRNDEIGDITSGLNEMVDRLKFTMNELLSSQQHADAMSRLATLDTLTGIRNKTAFDEHTKMLDEAGGNKKYGLVLLDLNNLKLINDNYGHEKGDVAIKKLSALTCEVFKHSPVFRVGGDEFIVILENDDYDNIEKLVDEFREKMEVITNDSSAEPWERISAAIGYALYEKDRDSGTDSVMNRADVEMYACKRQMKAEGL